VVDTLTFLADSDLARFTDLGKTLSFTHYGDLGRNISAVIRRAQLRGINIDFLMQAEQIDAVDGSQKFFPRSPGKTIVPVVKERADNIIFLTVEGGKHVAYTVPGEGHHAKSRDPLPARIETEDLNYQFLESCFVSYEIPAASADDLLELDEAITRLSEMKVSMELDPVDTAALRAFVGVVDGGKFNHRQCFNAYEAIVAQIKSTALEIEASELTSQITNNVETLTSMTPVNRATK
jgi:hypothetical protein